MNLVKARKYVYFLSLFIIIIGLLSFGIKGLNYSIDFTGGTLIEMKFDQAVNIADVRSVLADAGISQDSRVQEGEGNVIIIRTKELTQEKSGELLKSVEVKIGSYTLLRNQSVGPTIGKELRNNALLSVIIAFVLMIVYITIRFEFLSGLAAITALIHDILVTVGLVSLLGLEVDGAFIAALLTIVGYSINNTIIIFDRVRENIGKKKKGDPLDGIIHRSVMQTLARSINTSLTVVFVLAALILIGGYTIRSFILILLIGVVSGCYSSVLLASPLYYDFRRLRGDNI
ncbi:MAG: protein translocase subunit SecF [Thermacetogeniaceae bacterium]|jgi:preprotein translocase subunit SecF|nr:protein translocase subunit SecF [Syntrophomonadaceae bacterium]